MKPQTKFFLDKAIFFLERGSYQSAFIFLIQAKKIESKNTVVLRNLALCKSFEKSYGESIQILDELIAIEPNNFLAYSNKGNNLYELENYDEALLCHNRALEINPKYSEGWTNKGNVLYELGRYDEAIACHTNAIEIEPKYSEAWANKGNALYEIEKYVDAITCIDRAIKLEPYNYNAWNNKGKIFFEIKRTKEAIECYKNSLAIKDNGNAHENLAILLLSERDFIRGWKEYEWRWNSSNFKSEKIKTHKPMWNGKDEGRLLIWGEQGIGDQILFSVYLKEIEKKCIKAQALINEKLLPIFQRSFPKIAFLKSNQIIKEEEYDYQVPMGSLPHLLNPNSNEVLESNYPYLVKDKEKIKFFKNKISENDKISCGISWLSSNLKFAKNKSLNIEFLLKKLSTLPIKFINLQYGVDKTIFNELSKKINIKIDSSESIDLYNNLNEVQSLAGACDIVITSCNTTAHLVGSSGINTYLLAPKSKGKFWYWHNNDNKCVWYPSIKVFEQVESDNWDEPFDNLKKELEQYLEKKL